MVGLDGETVGAMLAGLHTRLREEVPSVGRVAVALHDPDTGMLSTFVNSTEGVAPLSRYRVPLVEVPTLRALASSRESRVVPDLSAFAGSESEHTRWVLRAGFESSYTTPFYEKGALKGFLFVDARERDAFPPRALPFVSAVADLAASELLRSLETPRILESSLRLLSDVSRFRDVETGDHLLRVSRLTRVILRGLPAELVSDEDAELIARFAPVHDVGKIAIPDAILRKPGPLTQDEMEVMRGHVLAGTAILDRLVTDMGLDRAPHLTLLRSIVRSHHERMDGTGYPDGLGGEAIPLEARVVGTADVLDALTSPRPYKDSWPVEKALAHLASERDRQLDARCVDAILASAGEVEAIVGSGKVPSSGASEPARARP